MIKPYMRLRQSVVARVSQFQQDVNMEPVIGPGTLYDCARLLREQEVRYVMVVTTPGFVRRGVITSFSHDLLNHGITTVVFSAVKSDPDIECIEQAAAFYRSHGCEAMVAIGGGSAIDCAKMAGALIARPKKKLRDLAGIMKVGKPIPYLIAVPTTAGTGSEVTAAAVFTDVERQRKYAISDVALVPDVAVLDANLLVSLSPQMTAYTGMDALTHAVEAYVNQFGSHASRKMAEEAVSLVFAHLKESYDDGESIKHREAMLLASYYAGIAFSNAFVGYVHALSHAVGGRYHTQHGLANAVLLPVVLKEYGKSAESRLSRLAEVIGLGGTSDHELAQRFIESVSELGASMGIPPYLPGLRVEDIPALAACAESEGNPLYPVPEIWERERFESVLEAVLEPKGQGQSSTAPSEPLPAETPFTQVIDAGEAAASAATFKRSGTRAAAVGVAVGAAVAAAALVARARKR